MLKYYCANIKLLENQQVFDQFLKEMNNERREKVLRCKKEEDKRRSLMAGILLKYALEKAGLDYGALEFSKTPDGKPVLLSNPDIHFSISHAKEYVCCLLSDVPVGVDIESADKSLFSEGKETRLQSMAEKCFSTAELQKFVASEEKKKLFLEYWTKKESYSKALGKGLKMDFSKIDTETNAKAFWSVWTQDGYCVSMYKEDGNYQNLSIEKLKTL